MFFASEEGWPFLTGLQMHPDNSASLKVRNSSRAISSHVHKRAAGRGLCSPNIVSSVDASSSAAHFAFGCLADAAPAA